ncbi:MAG: hypothetical protein A2381_17865 [Bdellovibrionales bacterium RIFOXYB1_FULL_37_110]|nr:MAG: hypothetical protein A2417_08655 [Bdellovibrionales bacterium RIFOXYC1_FULL_37_79]OFZ59838.1 MAG: hypothetical protein A2381_17865 [Bdellovibrionales bacterium RIFOXYB1_FULL_37_110]OFZ65452.1 MAG: hypothetical protein A2577_18400 [Bdellovibrionales bacterium RIFOXYD1_FULL_36_51]OFZ66516.1 MAG: hypothetical protein A2328_07235 [Bdellovibrionales bacterium RIFOXYB2_FULL_36_6]
MNMGFSNAIIDDFNAYTFSLMGMLIVFVGLVLIYLYIEFLPYFLDFLSKRKEKIKQRARIRFKKETASPKHLSSANLAKENMDEIMLSITTALHLEHSFLGGNQQYTWKEDVAGSNWKIAGKINGLSRRSSKTSW